MAELNLDKKNKAQLVQKLRESALAVNAITAECQLVYNECPDPRKLQRGEPPVRLYLCGAETLGKLLILQSSHDANLGPEKMFNPYRFSVVANLLNPSSSVGQYSLTFRSTSKQVTDPIKVERDLRRELAITLNTIHSDAEALIRSDHRMSQERATDIRNEASDKAAFVQREAFELLEDLQKPEELRKYDVRITSKKRAYIYAYCDFAGRHALLRENIPNFLYYKVMPLRTNATFAQFLTHAQNPFGDVFYSAVEQLHGGE